MAHVGEILVQQLIDQIKVESRIKGSDTWNITVLGLINEYLLSETETGRYSHAVVRDFDIPLANNQGNYQLPFDLANIKSVYYARDGEADRGRVLRNKNDFVEQSRQGREPKFYWLAGNEIILEPFSEIIDTDHLSIDYFQYPTALVVTDPFPIPKLIPVIKQKVIGRLHILNKDFNAADRMANSGEETEGKSETTEDNLDT